MAQRNEVAEIPSLELTPAQISVLEKLLNAGFRLVTLGRISRYLPVEKDGFVALLDPVEGRLKIFGQVGYRMGEGIGMLVDQGERKAFVWKGTSVAATPQLLADYAQFKAELEALLIGEV